MRYRPTYNGNFVLIGRYWFRPSDGLYLPAIRGGTSANTVMENIWAFGTDNGSESGHDLDTENTARTTQAADENFLVRMMARETAGKNDPWAMYIYCSYNGGTWTELSTTSSAGMPAFLNNDVSSRADDEATTHRLSNPASGTFTPGYYDDGTSAVGTSTVQLNGQYSEWEFCVQVDSTYASDSDEFEFRLEGSGGTDLDSYAGVTFPKVTMSITASVQVGLSTASISTTGVSNSIVPGAVSKTLNTATLSTAGVVLAVSAPPAGATVTLNTASISASGVNSSIDAPITIACNTASISASGVANTISTGWDFPFFDGFESGDVSAWDSSNGSPTINGTAAIDGSYGFELAYNDTSTNTYLNWTNSTHQTYRVKFKLDMNNLAGDDNDIIDYIITLSDNISIVGGLWLIQLSGSLTLFAEMRDNSLIPTSQTYVVTTGTEYEIEIEWDFNAGSMNWWVDGSPQTGLSGITSDNHYPDVAFLGESGGGSNFNSGSIYLDSFWLYDTERPSGETVTLGTASITTSGVANSINAPVSRTLDTAGISTTPVPLTVTSTTTITLGTASISTAGVSSAINAPITRALSTAGISTAGVPFAIDAPITIALNTATVTASGVANNITSTTTISLGTATISTTSIANSVVPGTATIALNTASIVTSGINNFVNAPPPGIAIVMNTASIVATPVTLTVVEQQYIFANTATIATSGVIASIVPGTTTRTMTAAAISANGVSITVDAQAGAVVVGLNTALIACSPVVLSTDVPISIVLNSASVTTSGVTSAVVLGGEPLSVMLDTASITTTPVNNSIVAYVVIAMASGVIGVNGVGVANIDSLVRLTLATAAITLNAPRSIILALLFPNPDNVTYVEFRDKRVYNKFRDKRTFVVLRDKRTHVE